MPAINGPADILFIITPIIILEKYNIRKKIHMDGICRPYPTVTRINTINIATIERNSGNHVIYRLNNPVALDKYSSENIEMNRTYINLFIKHLLNVN
jgi:hypothetical protein